MKGFLIVMFWVLVWVFVCFNLQSCSLTVNPDGSRTYKPDMEAIQEIYRMGNK